jgi:hypothetical protein
MSRASNYEDEVDSTCGGGAPLFSCLPQSIASSRQALFTNYVDDDDRIIFGGCSSNMTTQNSSHHESHVVNKRSGSFPNLMASRPVVTQKTITTTNMGTGETTRRYIKQTNNVCYSPAPPATTVTRTTVYTPLSYQYEPIKMTNAFSSQCENFNQSFNSKFSEVFGQKQQQQRTTTIQQHTPLFFEAPKTERYAYFW